MSARMRRSSVLVTVAMALTTLGMHVSAAPAGAAPKLAVCPLGAIAKLKANKKPVALTLWHSLPQANQVALAAVADEVQRVATRRQGLVGAATELRRHAAEVHQWPQDRRLAGRGHAPGSRSPEGNRYRCDVAGAELRQSGQVLDGRHAAARSLLLHRGWRAVADAVQHVDTVAVFRPARLQGCRTGSLQAARDARCLGRRRTKTQDIGHQVPA